jgi:hypothetical protein
MLSEELVRTLPRPVPGFPDVTTDPGTIRSDPSTEGSWIARNSCLFLLVALLLHQILDSMFSDVSNRALVGAMTTLILLSAIYAITHARWGLGITIVLGLPFLTSIWLQVFRESYTINITRQISSLLFLGLIVLILSGHVLTTRRITINTLYGAASIYLLLGYAWAAAYILLEKVSPGSYSGLTNSDIPTYLSRDLTYFSFVTLTTLGYGDIQPVSPVARSMAIGETVCGVLYLSFLVARLVAMYMMHSQAVNVEHRVEEHSRPGSSD